MTATAAANEVPMFKLVPISKLRPSPQNPRKKMRGLDELTASVREKGVLHPLLVRPLGVLNEDGEVEQCDFEIVAGERRWRASQAAELSEVPCIVREMDAVTALELALVENLERNDLSPMEEGKAFDLLMRGYKRTAEDVASKVGRSLAYVRQRLRMVALIAPLVKLLDAELLDLGAAGVLAQFPAVTQQKLHQAIVSGQEGERISRRDVQDAVRRFAHELAEAPFLTTDPKLVPDAGACTTCPTRTGRQGVLFEALDEPDVCLNDLCWSSKARAHFEHRKADAKKFGLRVLSDAEAKKIVHHGRPAYGSGFVSAAGTRYVGGTNVKVADLVGPDVGVTIALCPDTGACVELVDEKIVEAAKKLMERSAARDAKKHAAAAPGRDVREKEKRAQRAAETKALRLAACNVVANVVGAGRVDVLKALRAFIADYIGDQMARPVAERRQLEAPAKADRSPAIDAVLNEAAGAKSPTALVAILCELMAARLVNVGPYAQNDKTSPALAAFGVDLPKLAKVVAQELKDEKKRAPKTEKLKAPKARAKAGAR